MCFVAPNDLFVWGSLDHIATVIFKLLRCMGLWLIPAEHKKICLILHDKNCSRAFRHLEENEEGERREQVENVNNLSYLTDAFL